MEKITVTLNLGYSWGILSYFALNKLFTPTATIYAQFYKAIKYQNNVSEI